MTQYAELQKNPGRKSIIKKLILSFIIFILFLIITAVLLYIYSKIARTTHDDIAAIISTETMPVTERYTFDASSRKMEISMDKSDLWWLFKQMGSKDIIDEIASQLESSSITLQSYGMDITDKGIFISTELIYGDHLRLPLKFLIETTLHDSTLTIAPSSIYFGKIRLPIEKYPFSRLAEKTGMDPNSILNSFKYDIVLSDWSLLPTVTDIYFRDNRMVLVYKLDESLLSNSVNTFSNNIDWYAGEFNDCIEVLREYHNKGALGERFTKLIEKFSSDPGSFSGFISESLAISSKSASKEYLDEKGPWFDRFMPEINQKKISDMHDALYNLCAERATLFSSLMDKLQTSYNSNKLKIDERGFIYNDKPFNLENYLGVDWDKYSAWLDASSFRPVLIGALNAYALKTPILKKVTGSMDYVDKAADSNGKYPIGFIIKMKDGTPILKYCSTTVRNDESTEVVNRTVILDKAKYESMKNNPLVPVWVD